MRMDRDNYVLIGVAIGFIGLFCAVGYMASKEDRENRRVESVNHARLSIEAGCLFDNEPHQGDVVYVSSSRPGYCHVDTFCDPSHWITMTTVGTTYLAGCKDEHGARVGMVMFGERPLALVGGRTGEWYARVRIEEER